MGTITMEGENQALYYLQTSANANFNIALFTNPHVVAPSDDAASMSPYPSTSPPFNYVLATNGNLGTTLASSGSVAVLPLASWSAPLLDSNNAAYMLHPPVTFLAVNTPSPSPTTVYGYVVYVSSGYGSATRLMFAYVFPTSITVTNIGDFISISGIYFRGFDGPTLCGTLGLVPPPGGWGPS